MALLRIAALGGLGEIGMNCLTLETAGSMLAVDCGLTFPDDQPGVDVIHPDFTYLEQAAERLAGVVITHGHEDHIGALPYLLRHVDVPVYGPPHALALAEERLREHDLLERAQLTRVAPRQRFQVGAFQVEPYRVTHSIPDATGLILRSDAGTVIHSGDFKFEDAPLDGECFDEDAVRAAGDEGVDLLLSDSTNVEVEGGAGREADVVEALAEHMEAAPARIVVCLFASNVHRMGGVLGAARRLGKRVLLLGRSLHTHRAVAEALKMLPEPLPELVDEDTAMSVPRDQLVILATGSQGEPRAALPRVAAGTHPRIELESGDQVLLSSRVIPGNEHKVNGLMSKLERRGIQVIGRRDDPRIHVTGHACREDQRRLIALSRPRAFVPVHGTYVHLRRHADLARTQGVGEVAVVENGAVLELNGGQLREAGRVPAGRVSVQGAQELEPELMLERQRMAAGGMLWIRLWRDGDGRLIGDPELLLRGVADGDPAEDLQDALLRALRRALGRETADAEDAALRRAATRVALRTCREVLRVRPLVAVRVEWEDA